MDEVRLYGPTSNLGYGISKSDVGQALKWDPDVIFQQGTSTDPGPGYLGSSLGYSDLNAVKRDLELLIPTAVQNKIPLILSAGGSGSNSSLKKVLKLIDQISSEKSIRFRAAVIKSEIPREFIKRKIIAGERVGRLVEHPALRKFLSVGDVDAASRVVGQMSYEPVIHALDYDVDMVVTGRACDIALPMAVPLKKGFDKGLTAQVGKIVECGGAACERESAPAGLSTGVFAILRGNYGLIKSLNHRMKCSIESVISRGVFYERRSATIPEEMPDGHLDVSQAVYSQIDENTVRVGGGRFVQREGYLLKIEGVRKIGFRTMCVGGVLDPFLIRKVVDGSFLRQVSRRAGERLRGVPKELYMFHFRVYGLGRGMGNPKPRENYMPRELCIVIDVVASTPELSRFLCMICRQQLLHHPYPGRKTTAGNIAFPFSPSDIPVGEAYEFGIWHLLPLKSNEVNTLFRPQVVSFPGGKT